MTERERRREKPQTTESTTKNNCAAAVILPNGPGYLLGEGSSRKAGAGGQREQSAFVGPGTPHIRAPVSFHSPADLSGIGVRSSRLLGGEWQGCQRSRADHGGLRRGTVLEMEGNGRTLE